MRRQPGRLPTLSLSSEHHVMRRIRILEVHICCPDSQDDRYRKYAPEKWHQKFMEEATHHNPQQECTPLRHVDFILVPCFHSEQSHIYHLRVIIYPYRYKCIQGQWPQAKAPCAFPGGSHGIHWGRDWLLAVSERGGTHPQNMKKAASGRPVITPYAYRQIFPSRLSCRCCRWSTS